MKESIKELLQEVVNTENELKTKNTNELEKKMKTQYYLNALCKLSDEFKNIQKSKTRLTVFYKYFCSISYSEIDCKIKNKSRYENNINITQSDYKNYSRAHEKCIREITKLCNNTINFRFSQLYYLEQEIDVYTKYLSQYKKNLCTSSDTSCIFFNTSINYILVAKSDLDFFYTMLLKQKNKCDKELQFLNNCINSITDLNDREAFEYMYRNNKTIYEVQELYETFNTHYKNKCFMQIKKCNQLVTYL